ncbi:uroporphyrinogen-III C-methyltransferase [Staphylococcus felis]|uniref:uroporphyrinogen-III C-methyltransferase n=1 Tax=Staphylococcus felis TaxID=46127 RepID=UPI000CD02A58|nr:uroporphyrinogen-III C-methyltransferase [Staphylococcus felis]AVP36589.1 uroporphyrinogen-III C-methyltransferase [Staphylococcus felis]PNZ36686.1 uroporphyrinogen-III C-methyltransferase [Staphylococcus felis]QQB03447.1 uroporphyrinogen-III C-methyltransferase [Staphylococcus felis]
MSKVYLVGAGPGDPDLITLKAVKAIQKADVILYDRLVNKEIFQHASPQAKLLYCGKDPNRYTLPQHETNQMMLTLAKKGYTVVRLKGGDPFVFGRGGEEAELLAEQHIPFEIVPGITSGIAAPMYAGIPVTHRNYSSSVAFVTAVTKDGTEDEERWQHLAKGPETLCIYMGVKKLPQIRDRLIENGKQGDTPVALVHMGTTQSQETVTGTLSNIVEKAMHIQNPAMIIVGDVVNLRERISWFNEQLNMQSDHLIKVTSL